jgi:hypothetical protein
MAIEISRQNGRVYIVCDACGKRIKRRDMSASGGNVVYDQMDGSPAKMLFLHRSPCDMRPHPLPHWLSLDRFMSLLESGLYGKHKHRPRRKK